MTHAQWDVLADAINPLLVIALCILPFIFKTKEWWKFLLWSLLALGITELLAKGFRSLHLIEGKFPSTHFAFALCIATSMCLLHRRMVWILAPLLIAYCVLMRYQNYHTYPEMFGALYAIVVTLLCHRRTYYEEKEQPIKLWEGVSNDTVI